jgi:very-short-patch-repair endonuclease
MSLKKEFLVTHKCLECGILINDGTDNSSYLKFCKHIKSDHNIENSDYYVKYFTNGNKPLCLCGCGNETRFHKGNFHIYYKDHKNTVKVSETTIEKLKKQALKRSDVNEMLNRIDIDAVILEKAYEDFIELKKPMSKISEELFIDFRTLKSYWFRLGLIKNKDNFKRFTLKSKSKWFNVINKPNGELINLMKERLYLIKVYLSDKTIVTFDDILSLLGFKVDKNYLSWFLKENLSLHEIKKIKFIKQSQLEINFLNVLKFYFGQSIVGSFEIDGKIFDYKLGRSILIELDGDYWHSKEEVVKNDLIKNKIAKEKGYILIRVSDKEVKKIEFINKIKKIYDENK